MATRTTRANDACSPPSFAPRSRNPRIVTALACLIAALGAAALVDRALRRVPGFCAAARAGADRGTGARCDAGRSAGDPPARGTAGGHREREDGPLDLESRAVGDPGGLRPRRRSLPAAPGGHGTPAGARRPAARRGRRAAAVAAELLDGVPGALRLHQRPAVAAAAARPRAMDGQAANPRGPRRGAGADLRRRSARAADRRSIRSSWPRSGFDARRRVRRPPGARPR